MFWQDADGAQVTLDDASSCFSEDEWQHLHKWQKDLYKNVMKEIHHALMSLGPLIASTVFSLKSKEKEERIEDFERRRDMNHYSNDENMNSHGLFQITAEENQHLKSPREPKSGGRSDRLHTGMSPDTCIMKEEPVSVLIDLLGEDVEESSFDPSLGDAPLKRKWRAEDIMKYTEKTTVHRPAQGKSGINVFRRSKMGAKPRSQPLSEPVQEEREKEEMQHSRGLKKNPYTAYEGQTNEHNTCDSNARGAMFVTPSQSIPTHLGQFLSAESEQSVSYEEAFFDSEKSATVERRYHCSVCDKSFTRKQHFLGHQRTHTGERPYQCTKCSKSFNQMHHLARHNKIHAGDKPYQCTECGKSFSRKDNFVGHQRMHRGEKPFECITCFRRFSQKQTLIGHLRTHMKQRPDMCTFQL
ncbi:zinc finger protein 135-like isoform X2 [Ambystoma mexicanum]|uniref:zinc finger protein 135-like isoform X2 n=1 Tax=Ambystoma mexicanum TaxID=8296 RepID=UPI0037E987ED